MISDSLKKFRGNDYGVKGAGDKSEPDGSDKKDDGYSRTLAFTDDEKQALQGVEPGGEVRCEVRGRLEADGKLRVMSVTPLPGDSYGGNDEQGMAANVAQRVMPGMNAA